MEPRNDLPSDYMPAILSSDQLEAIGKLEKELGVILIAYEKDVTDEDFLYF